MKAYTHKKWSRFSGYLMIVMLVAGFTALASAQTYNEAPALAQRTAAGELPPVAERLPENPRVVEPLEQVGEYGGAWNMALTSTGALVHLPRAIGYEPLVAASADTPLIPNIAESFEASEDATEYIFRLRRGMKWSDGHPFTADDIMFWYEDVLLNEELTTAIPSWLMSGDEPVVVEKIDDYTVKFTFRNPYGLFLTRITQGTGAPITQHPKHYLSQFHISYNPEGIDQLIAQEGVTDWVQLFQSKGSAIPGTAHDARWMNTELPTQNAWVITQPVGTGQRAVVERNPYYWKVDPEGNQLPYLDRVIVSLVEDAELVLLRAMAGEIDFQDYLIADPRNVSVLADNQERGNYRFFEFVSSASNMHALYFNLTHRDPVRREIYQNDDFRIGLSYAINREEIIDLIYLGLCEPWQTGPRPETAYTHERLAKQYTEYDVALANEHLDRAGFTQRDAQGYRLGPDGNRLSFAFEVSTQFPNQVDTAELLERHFREVGVEMQIRAIERSLFGTRTLANEHDVASFAAVNGYLHDPTILFPYSNGSYFAVAWARWFNTPDDPVAEEPPAVVKQQMDLYRQIESTADSDRQIDLMMQILDISADQFYTIGICLPTGRPAVVKNYFRNTPEVVISTIPYPGYSNPEQYFIDDAAYR
jgi:peptide/nickel transport system substrate-binding protein